MSVTNESRIRSWFQFTSKSSANNTSNSAVTANNNNNANNGSNAGNGLNGRQTDDESTAVKDLSDNNCPSAQPQTTTTQTTNSTSNTLLERVTSFRRSLGKAQNKKNKIRPTSVKGQTSGAVEQQIIAKSKNSSVRKSSSPTSSSVATSGGSTAANCDDDEIYGFTSANLDSSANSTRRQLKSSFQSSNGSSNAPNVSIAPNINVYESDTNKSGRVKNEERDDSHAITATANNTTVNTVGCKVLSQDSPEWLKADKEFSFYNQQNPQNFDSRESIQSRLYYYKQQYFHDSDINLRHSSTQHLSWVGPISSDTDDIDRIYENMRGLSSALASAQQRHRNVNSNNLYANSVNNSSDNNVINNNNRKLTKDSGYESASASISNWSGQPINSPNNAFQNNYFHCRSDSNTSSVSTGGSMSPRTAANKSAYHYCDQWSAAKSTSNLPLQVQVSGNRRSSLSGSTHHYSESIATNGLPVLPAKSVPGNLDRDSDENIVKKRSQNRNNPTPSSVYSLLASKSGFDFAPVLKSSRKSCGPAFGDNQFAKYSERFLPKKLDSNGSQLWKTREKSLIASYGSENRYEVEDSPPPTPPVRDSSLASNRKFNPEVQEIETQSKLMSESLGKGPNECGLYYKNNNSHYYLKNYSESSVVSHIGCSKSLINLRSKYEESSDLKQFSQTYPLLPETEFNDKSPLTESWSCDQSVTSGVTSLVTTSDYFTASSSVITHSPSLSSLSTNATNTTYNNSRNSISSTGSSSQIAKSSKVVQPKRESASVLYSDKSGSQSSASPAFKSEVPPPPPPKMNLVPTTDRTADSSVRTGNTCSTLKMVSNSRSIETSKSQRSSDPEIKAIQKRAVYQFYLKQKQKERHDNSNNNNIANTNVNASITQTTAQDNSQVPSRKVHLVVTENIYENSSAQCISTPPLPSPPLPPPPQTTVADIEFVVSDLPLPPPPSVDEFQPESATNESHNIDIFETSFVSKGQQTGRSPSPPKAPSPPTLYKSAIVSQKSEIATQTTDTLGRKSGSASPKELTQQTEPSLESNETMNQKPKEVPTTQTTNSEQSSDYKSIESVETVVPWAYSKLFPNENCAKTSHYDSDNSHISTQNSSSIGLANTYIGDTGPELNNEDLLNNKSEIISILNRRLDVLRSEEMALVQDIDSNETLGQQLRNRLKTLGLTAQESEKINLHCDETEKVTRLLLSISARLRLIETQMKTKSHKNCLSNDCNDSECKHKDSTKDSMGLESAQNKLSQNDLQQIRDKQTAYSSTNFSDEIQSLVSKREKLLQQLEEAIQLRVSIDQRNQLIEDKIIKKYFKNSEQNFNEFLEFIKLKSKLIVDIRGVRDQIENGQKRLFALQTNS